MKEIPSLPGYFATEEGKIFSNRSGSMYEMKQHERKGYLRVSVRQYRASKLRSVHRLILEAFRPKLGSELLEVNHINGIKNDNRLENLEWCTRSENALHSYALNLQNKKGENNGRAKMNEFKVREVRKKFEEGYSVKQMAEEYGLDPANIRRIINRETWKHVE